MATLEIMDKFNNDATFYNMVNFLEKGLLDKTYDIQELKEVCELAIERYEIRKLLGFVE